MFKVAKILKIDEGLMEDNKKQNPESHCLTSGVHV